VLSQPCAAQAVGGKRKVFSSFAGHSHPLYGSLSGVLTLFPRVGGRGLRQPVNVIQGFAGKWCRVRRLSQSNDSFKRDTPCRGIVGVKGSSSSQALFRLHGWRAP